MPVWQNNTRYTVKTENVLGQHVTVRPGDTVDSFKDLSIYNFTKLDTDPVPKIINGKVVFETTVTGDAENNASFTIPNCPEVTGKRISKMLCVPGSGGDASSSHYNIKIFDSTGAFVWSGYTNNPQPISEQFTPHFDNGCFIDKDLTVTLTGLETGKKMTVEVTFN